MNYRSVADLAQVVRTRAYLVPPDIDLVVGIPRSGMLAANLIALALNVRVTDLTGWIQNIPLPPTNVRDVRYGQLTEPHRAKHVLLVDDSIQTGQSMGRARALAMNANLSSKITCCAVFAHKESMGMVDLVFDLVPIPRVFEWNVMHRKLLERCCVDIDGVLCADPTPEENDDGDRYRIFLSDAKPLCIPSYPIGHLVTSRLESYREQTTAWLQRQGVSYSTLHMLDLPDAETRRTTNAHAVFKAAIYSAAKDTVLFIESNRNQAIKIAKLSGKPTLCFSTQEMFGPEFSIPLVSGKARSFFLRIAHRLLRLLRSSSRT